MPPKEMWVTELSKAPRIFIVIIKLFPTRLILFRER